MLRCKDGSLYTGITKDLRARVDTHNAGKGAKYTRAHLPVELVYSESAHTESEAKTREAALKKLSRSQKEKILCV